MNEGNRTENEPLRLAIVSTPRSGNTWLRYLLSEIYAVPSLAAHAPDEVDWAMLPSSCLLQIHWHRTVPFLAQLAEYRFQVVVIARHPLDVLISHLHHALHTLEDRSLNGEGGNERAIIGAMPRSTAFLRYATGPRAAALLSVTAEWWRAPAIRRIRYESLVTDAPRELQALTNDLDAEIHRPIDAVVAELTMENLRVRTGNERHFWMGRPGLWRQLLTAAETAAIAAAHAGVFAELDYPCDADLGLEPDRADAYWIEMMRAERANEIRKFAEAQQTIVDLREQDRQTKAHLEGVRLALEESRRALEESRLVLEESRRALEESQHALEEVARREARPCGLAGLVHHSRKAFNSLTSRLISRK